MKIRSSERWQKIESIFASALPLSREARDRYLDESCGDDPELKAELQQLLDANEEAGEFLERLDVTAAARLLDTASGAPGYLGRYKVVRKIGAGGMGIVYLAEDQALKRLVAVKLLPPWLHGSSQANRRLLEEARAASAIDHPNIATIHEIGETEDGRLFITMSYYEGGTLRDRMATGPIPVDTAIDIALQIARGLAAAHRKGIVHRDIKPENVLITADGMVKVADFGLASLELQATSPGTSPAGTAAYMSPEQSRGAALDARTDVWSLGVVLYEMLAGGRPSAEAAVNESIDAAPAQLREIVGRCLEKDPVARYASADQVIEDLRSVRAIIAGGSPNRDVMMQRSSRNRRARVVGGFAILTLAAIGTAAAWRNARDANTEIITQGPAASVAVLPFADVSPDSDRDYISDGLTEELIHALAGIDGLRVISRSSVMQFQGKDIDVREAASKLGVAHILEGSVRSAKGRLRITLRLVDAARGDEVWSQVFDRADADLLAVQGEIAGAVVTALRVKLGPADQVSLNHQPDPRAHGLFLKGQRLFHQRQDLDRAVRFFREAIAIDPKFARAWTGLSRTWLIIPVYTTMPVPEALDSAETAVRTALSLDPNLADAHATLASMMADDWRWAESEPHFLRALELSGGDATTHQWYGEMLFRTGRIDEAIARFKTAEQANPLQSVIPMVLGWAYLASERTQEALAAFREATVLDPRDVQAHVGIGYSLLVLNRFSEAMPAFEKAVELTNGQQATRAHLARGYALSGRRPEAMKILEQLKAEAERGTGSAWGVAVVAASLGLEDEALRWLERGYQHREIGVGYLKTSEAFKPMRSHPGFVALLRKMGL